MIIVVGTLKGGVGKTTTVVYLGFGLAAGGSRVLLVDADPQAKTLSDHRGVAGDTWPDNIVVTSHAEARSLARDVRGLAAGFDHVVIDVGGEDDVLLSAALSIADELVAPVTPSLAELRRLPATFHLAEKAAIGAGREIGAQVLLVKTERRSVALRDALKVLAEEGLPVLDANVRYLPASIPNTFGTAITDLLDYGPVLDELRGYAAGTHQQQQRKEGAAVDG